MRPLISVVLPIYRVEPFLERCLSSVVSQSYSNLEIILVDDGSPDNCPAMCDEFAKKDPRIVVIHKENGGLSDARNAGIRIAKGEYITFIDPDDYVENTYVSYLYSLIEKYGCRMSLCTHTVVFENGKRKVIGDNSDEKLDARQCLERMLYHDVIDTSAWAKLYHRDLFQEITYPEGMLFEDIGTTYRFMIQSGEIACGYKSQYFYILRKHSIVSGAFHEKKLDLITMTDQMAEAVERVFPDLKEAVLRRRVHARFSTLNQMLDVRDHRKEKREIIAFIKKNGAAILHNKKAPKRDKVGLLLLKLGYPVYRAGWKALSRG